jgi:hypothetical protein
MKMNIKFQPKEKPIKMDIINQFDIEEVVRFGEPFLNDYFNFR